MKLPFSLTPQMRVYAAFFIYAFALGAIYPRIGDLQLSMGVGEGVLGLALIGPGIGAFIALTFVAPMLKAFNARMVLISGNILLICAVSVAAFAPNPWFLFVALFCAGLVTGGVEVVVNLEADRLEHHLKRRIMNRAHAFWSFGFFFAGLVGAVAKQSGMIPQLHLVLLIPFVILMSLLFLGGLEPAPPRFVATGSPAARVALPSMGIMALVVVALSAMFLEGAGADWSVIYMRESFNVAPFINGSAFAIGALGQALMRYFADGFIDRHGPVLVARSFLTLMGSGAILVTIAPTPFLALAGFALIGVGASVMFPLAVSAAAQRTDRPAEQNVAALSQFVFVAFLLGPPMLGFIAEHFGVRYAFAVCVPLVALSLATSKSLIAKQ